MKTKEIEPDAQVEIITRNPAPAEVREERVAADLTQTAAGEMVHTTCRTWQQWEAGDRRMHPAFWELFRIKARLLKKQGKGKRNG